ncbi:MAG: TetR/AcrR family transcriptional regulator [Pseudomonadota bacterium]
MSEALPNTDPTPTRAGRPKSDSKRMAIMRAATGHFMSEGYERTSMDAIATAAGVSKQTVYSHFANKDALFRECILTKIRRYGLDMKDFADETPLREVLETTARRFLDLLSDEDVVSMYRLLIAETTAFPKLSYAFWETGPEQTLAAISHVLSERSARGECQIDDPKRAASDFLCLVESHYLKRRLMRHMTDIDPDEREAHVTRCVDQVLRLHDHRG